MSKIFTLCDKNDLSLDNTFDCGQCFRWDKVSDTEYVGIAMGAAARVYQDGNVMRIETSGADEEAWRKYFDLDTDYNTIASTIQTDDFMRDAISFNRGMRILRQEPWEALCSFIISQCNNIPRIKKIVHSLCERFGDCVNLGGTDFFAFPPVDKIAVLMPGDLAFLRAGYREEYILTAAYSVNSGVINFDELMRDSADDARKKLTALKGIGNKVANCVLLFGLGKTDAFPVDTWMKKTAQFYPYAADGKHFGKYAGIAQQYIFNYARKNMSNILKSY